MIQQLPRFCEDPLEMLLQLKYDKRNNMLLGTTGKGFAIWTLNEPDSKVHYMALPHGVRNITTRMMVSNSVMVSATLDFAVAGVRYIRETNIITI